MGTPSGLKAMERKAFTFAYQDGLWDLAFACLMLGHGLGLLTGQSLYALLILAGPLLMIVGKRWLTQPRLGMMKPGAARKKRIRTIRLITAAASLLVLALFLAVAAGLQPSRGWVSPALVIGIPAVLFAVARAIDFERLYGYAVLIGCAVALNEYFSMQLGGWVYLTGGVTALLLSLTLLGLFLKRYKPVPQEAPVEDRHAHS